MLFLNDGVYYNTDKVIYINLETGYVRFNRDYYTIVKDKGKLKKIIDSMGVIELESDNSEEIQKRSPTKKKG